MLAIINWKKIGLYLLLSFSISWAIAAIIKIFHIEISSFLGVALIGGLYMPGPAIATFILQKFIYKEGFQKYGWTFDRSAMKWILLTPVFFLALLMLVFATIGLLGNTHIIESFGQLDFSQESFNLHFTEIIKSKVGVKIPQLPAKLLFVVFILQGIMAGATINLPFMFGEEFGWRGLLLHETRPMGFWGSALFIGIIWGLWHLPIVLMGHNYPSNPQWGVAMMCLFTTSLCPLFAYIRLKTKSILGACMLHGMINATGSLFVFYVSNPNDFYSSVAGWAGVIAGIVLSIFIGISDSGFVKDFAQNQDAL